MGTDRCGEKTLRLPEIINVDSSKFLFALPFRDGIHTLHARECKMTLLDASSRTLSSIETIFSLLCLDGERVEGQVRGSRAWKGGVDVKTLEEVHSSVRQAEQRNNQEEHGAKRGVRGLYKLGQRVLTESPHRTSPHNAICSSLPSRIVRMRPSNVCACACAPLRGEWWRRRPQRCRGRIWGNYLCLN